MQVQIIRTDGTEETVELPLNKVFAEIERLIHATALDTVNLRDGRVMLVDDHGYDITLIEHGPGVASISGIEQYFNFRTERRPTRARKPVNPKATALYQRVCVPGTTHQIVGDVAIVVDAEFDTSN